MQTTETRYPTQRTFNPARYGFEWTDDWYTWDSEAAHKAARRDRDAAAKALQKEGYRVKRWTMRNQLITLGGIGSGHPEISEIVTVYGFNAS